MALIVSSLLFAWGHLERSRTSTPDLLSLLVLGLDGVGFGIAYLATRSLWLPTIWHATKNIWIWLLFSECTQQLTHGFFQVNYTGPMLWVGTPNQAGLLDVLASFVVAMVLLLIYRHQFASGLEWIESQ
ncbi:MAG: CPBP family intramembrane metalloprotease [Chloroflexota bacterium]|nr:MAG: CPBP family intramembrane metalloprotease [Chloroflexota bacterium]